MIIEKNNRREIIISDGDKKIIFTKHEWLPKYEVELKLGSGGGNASGLKFTRDAVSWIFNETPCIMLHGVIEKTNPASRAFSLTVPWEQYDETPDFWKFRCGIQYWIDNAKGYNMSKAEGKRP